MRSFVMRSRVQAIVLPSEIGEFSDEIRSIFQEFGRAHGPGGLAGECSPAIDVYETDEAIEIGVDLPGVGADAVRVVVKGNAVLIAGEKAARRVSGDSSFHLVERGFGRFARSVRLAAPCDGANARATLDRGELRVTLPKIGDRRRRAIHVPVGGGKPAM
jgi:HSP20 family protein